MSLSLLLPERPLRHTTNFRFGSGAPVRRSRKQTFDPDWRLQAAFRHIAVRRRSVGL